MNQIYKHIKNYQKDASTVIKKYMNSTSKKNCLIKLPTGTGKTGVMAVASNFDNKNILIVVPSASLPNQTATEIEELFWNNIGYRPSKLKKTFIIRNPKNKKLKSSEDGLVYIVTIQTLLNIFLQNKPLFLSIKNNIDIIFYDEGHREPAKEWANASQSLDKKTVLFTATPYRNDNFNFNIDNNFSYEYSMKDAINAEDLKKVVFKPISNNVLENTNEMKSFIEEIAKNPSKKILVRCKNENDIKELVECLGNKYSVLGCHSKLKNGKRTFKEGNKLIQHIKANKFQILLHNDMLIEGVNIPELNTLVFFEYFKNYKSVIQQIGRILRISDVQEAIIYVPGHKLKQAIQQWELYLNAEKDKDNYSYINGLFKKSFSFEEDLDLLNIMQFKKQAIIYVSKESCFSQIKKI